ncbi:hypothetical protein PMAYCL1PPCAC_14811, partial [Pristionchus mayeri]
IFLFALVVEYVQNYLFTWASEQIGNECRRRFIGSILSRDSLQSEKSTGELSNQLSSHIDRMKEGLGEKVGEFVRCLSTFITCCTISFIIDWQTALILFWSGPVYLLTSLIPKLSANAAKQSLRISEEAAGISEESILNVKTVVSCNGQKQMIEVSIVHYFFIPLIALQKYSSILQSGLSPSLRIAIVEGFLDALSNFLYVLFHCIGLWWATVSYHNGRIPNAGDVFAVTFLALSSASSFSQLGPHLFAVMKARAAAAIVYETIEEVRGEDHSTMRPKADPSSADLHIEFRDVSYSFPSRSQPALRNLSFSIQAGQSLGLVGKSGCGKSTTLKLLTRVLEEQSGSILLDGFPLSDYDKRKWREMTGVVSQEPCLFTGSIRENICLGRPFTDQEVEEAARIAHAHHFIDALDEGYSSLLGASGVSLSGGQKQRIAIARAIVSRPRLLLLDEATSALDSKSERIVQKALDSASQGRSTIVVAHRLSTIKSVDRVMVMQDGEVVESGEYSELRVKQGGLFSRMATEQEMERRQSKEEEKREESEGSSEDDDTETVEIERRESGEVVEGEFPSTKGGFLAIIGRNKGQTAVIFLLGIMKALASILLSARFFFIFGSLEGDDYTPLLFWLTVGTIAIGLYNFFFQFISKPICQYLGETMMNDVRVECLRSLLGRPMAYFDRQSTSPSACAVLLSQQPPTALSLIDHKLSTVVDGLVACFGVIILTFVVCLPSGVVGVSYLVFYLILLLSFEKINDRAYQEVVEVDKSGELAMEIFDNVATIQQLAVEKYFQQKYDQILERRDVPLSKKIRCQSIVHSTNWSIFLLFNFIATTIGVYFVYIGHYTTKQLFTTESLVADIGFATYVMSFSFKDMVAASSAAKLLFGLIDPSREEEENRRKPNSKGALKSKRVTFAYPSQPRRNVLNDVTFSVDQGKSIAFVGPSGGGKSTIVNLLERFYDPKSGQMLLDDLPFASLTSFQLRSEIALVSQEPILFRGSIMDNVRLGTEGVSEDEVKRACELANASEFIQEFHEGYSTLVGEKGRSLSGGQKQRIAIARALVRNPKVIILDEATSALDTQSEKVIRSALESSARGRTSVMIAHRLDTIRQCG